MLSVYKALTKMRIQLTPEVKGVFDRMLASEEEIANAEAARSYTPQFASAADAGMTPEQWADYQMMQSLQTQTAVDELTERSLKDMQWLANAKSKVLKKLQAENKAKRDMVEKEVAKEVRQQPVYAAMQFLKFGRTYGPDGEEIEVQAGNKLSIDALKELYPEGELAQHPVWQELGYGKHGMLAKDGIDPDLIAGMFGFRSADHLVQSLLSAEPEEAVVEREADKRMLERYGDLGTPAGMQRAVSEALHNKVREKVLATELNALSKINKSTRGLTQFVKQFAQDMIAKKKIREVRPSQHEAAEARAARGAEKAKGVVEKATEKRNQLIHHHATRAAYEALEYVEKNARYLRKIVDSTSIDPDYRDQIAALLDRYELRKITNKEASRRQNLKDWVAKQNELGYDPDIAEELLTEANRKPYREMTVEEFHGLVDAVRNIEHLGRLKHKLLTAKDKKDFAEAVQEFAASVREHAKRSVAEARSSDRGPLVEVSKLAKGFMADHRKLASIIREFDGWKDGGVVWDMFVRPMNDAGNFEAVEREKATIALSKILKQLMKKDRNFTTRREFRLAKKSFSREEIIGLALNMGNEVNRERVMTGENLSPQALGEIFETLSKEDWDAVQAVWDFFDTYRPMMGAKQRRLTGTEPEWVQALPFTNKHGSYRGGYYPIAYDPERSSRSEADTATQVQKQIERGAYSQAQTRKGHLKARVESTGRPLRYDFASVIVQHVDQVVHDLAWHEWLIDANRLLKAEAIEAAIREHYGAPILKTMKKTLTDIAVGDMGAQEWHDRLLNNLRKGASIAGLGWRVTTSLLQPIGLTQSMARIGSKWVLKGMFHWIGDTASFENSVAQIYAKSSMMRLRGKTMQREISEIRNQVSGKDSKIEASYFWLIQKMQMVADVPTWWGAYEKAMAQGDMTEEKAIALADQAVLDSQGGGQIKDLAGVQRGSPAWKLWTNFYSFFNTTYNLTVESVGRTNFKRPGDVAALAVDMALLYAIPAMMGTLLKAALAGDWDDEDKLIRRLIADQISYLLGTVILLREAGGVARVMMGDYGDYRGPAGVRLISEITNLGKQIGQSEIDAPFLKALNSVGGLVFHYPAGQINNTVEGIWRLAQGETENPGAVLVGAQKK